jgi:hypothetical protein
MKTKNSQPVVNKLIQPKQRKSPRRNELKLVSSAGSLVFISHDSRDAELAQAFSKLLTAVSAGLRKSFRSSDREGNQGIAYGVEWFPQIIDELRRASDVVCLLTTRSLDRPWLLYEAGVAKGIDAAPVHGIALGIPLSSATKGPFAQFQNCSDEAPDLTKLVMQLVGRIPGSAPERAVVEQQVNLFRQEAANILKDLDKSEKKPSPKTQPATEATVAKLFEEVKAMFRDMPTIRESYDARSSWMGGCEGAGYLMRELMGTVYAVRDPAGLLVVFACVRDALPWMYELAREVYSAYSVRSSLRAHAAIKSMRILCDLPGGNPMFEKACSAFSMDLRDLVNFADAYVKKNPIPSLGLLKKVNFKPPTDTAGE